MDWRKYFATDRAILGLIEKANPYHDQKGRFARRGYYGAKTVNLAVSPDLSLPFFAPHVDALYAALVSPR